MGNLRRMARTTPAINRILPALFLLAAVAFVVVCIVFFATSHPKRGVVLVVLAVASLVAAWLVPRLTRPR